MSGISIFTSLQYTYYAKYVLITPTLGGLSAGEGWPLQIKSRKPKHGIHEIWNVNGILKIEQKAMHIILGGKPPNRYPFRPSDFFK